MRKSKMTISKSCLVALALTLSAPSAFAKVELVLTSLKGAPVADMDRARNHALVRQSTPVFTASEKAALEKMGEPHIARALRLTVDSEARASELSAWMKRQGLKVKLEPNAVAFTLEAPPQATQSVPPATSERFYPKQWALENTGQVEQLAVDDLSSVPIQGTPGEDIGIKNAPPENMDPSKTIIFAVLDTGIAYDQPELEGRVAEKASECRALAEYTKCQKDAKELEKTGVQASRDAFLACDTKYATVDTDDNGYPMDCSGWNLTSAGVNKYSTVLGDPNPIDQAGHGTHVAGTIAAAFDSNFVRGAMRNARILPVKVFAASPNDPAKVTSSKSTANRRTAAVAALPSPKEKDPKSTIGNGDVIARGVLYALRSNAHVINMSLGWPKNVDSNLMRQMIELAQSRGVLIVAAAGNDSTDALVRPCIYNGVICVASHDPNGALSNFSNYGSGVDIAAPGMNILSTYPTDALSDAFTEAVGYEVKSGTSMATPYVAAVLGRLLNAGFSPREAYARMIVGARPHQPSTTRSKVQSPMFTLSGNADLARAFAARPQPLILPAEKAQVSIQWNRSAREVPFKIPLKNFWTPASKVTVSARLLPRNGAANDASLSVERWQLGSWQADETKALPTALLIRDRQLESDLRIEVSVTATGPQGQVTREFVMQAEVTVPLDRALNDPDMKTLPIAGAEKIKGRSLRTVTSLDASPLQDYIAIEKSESSEKGLKTWNLRLVKEDARGNYAVTHEGQTTAPENAELLLLQRTDLDFDNVSEYVLVWRALPTAERKRPAFIYAAFDERLQPAKVLRFKGEIAATVEYDNADSVIDQYFQWMKLENRRVTAWIARGSTPDLNKPAFDPWNPDPIEAPEFRFYYFAPDGIRIVKPPENYAIIAMLKPSPDQLRRGAVPVLYAKGRGTETAYATAEVVDGKIEDFKDLPMEKFRALRGTGLKPVMDLSRSMNRSGTVFSTDSVRAALRVTALVDQHQMPGFVDETIDHIMQPTSGFDAILSVSAAFVGNSRSAIIGQSIYEFEYLDLKTNETASTSQRRYSFLPTFFFFSLSDPVVVRDSLNPSGERLPGMYVPSGFGLSDGMEVIAPRYRSGRLEGLVRPARLRFTTETSTTCDSLTNTIPASADQPNQVMFYCGDRFVRVPLEY